jgi:hypothetical protein
MIINHHISKALADHRVADLRGKAVARSEPQPAKQPTPPKSARKRAFGLVARRAHDS